MDKAVGTVKAGQAGPARPAGPAAAASGQASVTAKPKLQAADGQAALLALLKVEADARDAANVRDLIFIMANETRKLTRARQIFILLPGLTGSYEVRGVSSLPAVDRNTPLVILIEQVAARAKNTGGLEATRALELDGSGGDGAAEAYPFRSLVWIPLKHGPHAAAGGVVLAREEAWASEDLVIANRLAATYAHALAALKGPRRTLSGGLFKLSRWHAAAAAAIMAALLFVPVPLSALAPVEIVARDPFVVAAPIDGVIESVLVEPNQKVKTGDLLVKLADTTLRNRVEVAAREVQVAEARLKQANQVAFDDPRGMHEIGIARAELALKLAGREFAAELLSKAGIRAQRDGIAMYGDKRDLVGRPVAVGERMLEVADETAIEARIELPVSDAIALSPGARVKLFLDSDPLTPWHAAVKRADYKARVGDNDVTSFRVVATLESDSARAVPRLGVRGTAQISGRDVALGLYLFRRPITAVRQWTGL